ncbi:MAG: hypothetical protein P1U47_17195 [Zhongshania sp.]|uniref:DEAD/DEAH box helicase n=1 Tax=Zhongshania sp. TaxID=1971902 RepID=UPI002620A244|nr:hypothetical protein [Zhongshania sp.]MDF1694109.1 hypothetical protein [Zhongshania sp.]
MARNQLDIARLNVADAAGLVVATNIEHAHKLAALLQQMGENALVVSTHRPDAGAAIDQFRIESSKWIVAVGMISEGTDIPRLAVCCYLSRIRTEMSFRQVLGRVLRRRGRDDDQAWMFMIAEPELIACAERLMEDLPEHLAYGNHLQFVPLEDREAGSCSANGAQDYQLNITEDAIAYADGNSQKNVGGSQAAGFMGQLILSGSFRERLLNFF